MMHQRSTIEVGVCTYGPVVLSQSTVEENKFSIVVINYDTNSHYNLVTCKTTSKKHDKVWPGEFIIDDFFGKGRTKVQPYNVIRIQKPKLVAHRYVGALGQDALPKFELGLKIAVKKGLFDAKESLDLADTWQNLFRVS